MLRKLLGRVKIPVSIPGKVLLCILAVCVIIPAVIGIYALQLSKNPFVPPYHAASQGLVRHISLSGCDIRFNEGHPALYVDSMGGDVEFLHSKEDISKPFGFDPLKGIWLPADFKLCLPKSDKDLENSQLYSYSFFTSDSKGKARFSYNSALYMQDPSNPLSKTVMIAMSRENTNEADQSRLSGLEAATIDSSNIFGTQADVVYTVPGVDDTDTEEFSALFTCNGMNYVVFTRDGVTQEEFVNIVLSIIKS